MINQTKMALNTLSAIYGNPKWRGGADEKKIISEWDKVLEKYNEDSVKTACLRYAKYKKDGGFPNITCIEAELVDVDYSQSNNDKKQSAYQMYEYLLLHANECNPVPSELAIKRTIWRNFNVAVDGYNPSELVG